MGGHPNRSALETARLRFEPALSDPLQNCLDRGWQPVDCQLTVQPGIQKRFPRLASGPALAPSASSSTTNRRPVRCGVVFSGGPASGGHNVLWGLWDALQSWHSASVLVGFLNGPGGILEGKSLVLTHDLIAAYRNQGGFDALGSGRTKIETEEQLAKALAVCQQLSLDGLVIVGGDDSNTNAAVLAEYALNHGSSLQVVGVPKTIDGDLRSLYQPISFGFDTATKVYSEAIGNIARDAASSRKYTHMIKLMGRSASHVTLECALQTQPNLAFIGEECLAKQITLAQIVDQIVDWFIARQRQGNPYGVILLPEGLVEFLVDVGQMMRELNRVLAQRGHQEVHEQQAAEIAQALPAQEAALWNRLPEEVRGPLLGARDPHGNVPLSAFETEKMVALLVAQELRKRGVKGFNPAFHFLGYEGRCALPTNFDATLCYGLGRIACALIAHELTGYLASVVNPADSPMQWRAMGIPLVRLMDEEERGGQMKPVIAKTLVDLKGSAFQRFAQGRGQWAQTDSFRSPGPVQFFGDEGLTWQVPLTLIAP